MESKRHGKRSETSGNDENVHELRSRLYGEKKSSTLEELLLARRGVSNDIDSNSRTSCCIISTLIIGKRTRALYEYYWEEILSGRVGIAYIGGSTTVY